MYRPTNISSSAPTVNDDYSAGFRNGNFWRTPSSLYVLEDDAVGAADWQNALSGEDLGIWASWTPVITWTGSTPTGVVTVGRYCIVGETVYILLQVRGTGGISDTTDMSCTLPVTAAYTPAFVPLIFYNTLNSGSDVGKDNFAVIDSVSDPRVLGHVCFPTIGTEVVFGLFYAGFYERE